MYFTGRRASRRLLPAVLVVLFAALVAASTANATCSSSTPTAIALGDSPTDAQNGLAPEITIVTARIDAACVYSVDPAIAAPLDDGDAVLTYIDVDGDASTGSELFAGADVVVAAHGANGADSAPLLGKWNPDTDSFSFADAPSVTLLGNGGFSATLDQLGVVVSPTITTVVVEAVHTDGAERFTDRSPEAVFQPLPLSVVFSTIAPLPPPPPPIVPYEPPTAPPAPPAPPVSVTPPPAAPTVRPCTVPKLKGLRTASAKAALRRSGCKVGATRRSFSATVRSGRVIASSPRAGAKTSKPVQISVSRGPRPKQSRRAHRAATAAVGEIAATAPTVRR